MTAPKKARVLPERRPLRIAVIAGAALFLTGTFAYLRFPYDRLAASLTARLEQDAGVRLEIGRLAASPSLAGPGLLAEDVRFTRSDGSVFRVERMRVRLAWSMSWLTARPALHLAGASPLGEIEGVAVLWGPQRFSGTLREVDLTELLGAERLPGARLEGRASFDLDVAFEPEGPRGPVQINAKDGVLSHPNLPMALPFEQLSGEIVLGGDHWLEIPGIELRSPLGNGTLTGTVGKSADPSQAPLELKLALQVSPEVRGSLTAQGVRVGREGEMNFEVLGTASSPIIR